ncbi:hypothetical protein BPORC_1861 [Bifidobacterium porcinum]|nr:hypothetical protein BPORC_1861 [Bifidobacterium porcinum]
MAAGHCGCGERDRPHTGTDSHRTPQVARRQHDRRGSQQRQRSSARDRYRRRPNGRSGKQSGKRTSQRISQHVSKRPDSRTTPDHAAFGIGTIRRRQARRTRRGE